MSYTPDFTVSNQGSLMLLQPLTAEANAWVSENISDEAMRWAGAVVVEPRYIDDVVNGIMGDGLTVA